MHCPYDESRYAKEPDNYEAQRPEGQPNSVALDNNDNYRPQEQNRDSDVLSRGPYYNIHKPFAAHIQVIEDKDEYRQQNKDNIFDGQPSYGFRTQVNYLF